MNVNTLLYNKYLFSALVAVAVGFLAVPSYLQDRAFRQFVKTNSCELVKDFGKPIVIANANASSFSDNVGRVQKAYNCGNIIVLD